VIISDREENWSFKKKNLQERRSLSMKRKKNRTREQRWSRY